MAIFDAMPGVRHVRGQPYKRPGKLQTDRAYDRRRCQDACRVRSIKPTNRPRSWGYSNSNSNSTPQGEGSGLGFLAFEYVYTRQR